MSTDEKIQHQIAKALEASCLLRGAVITVTVSEGVATLTGYADKFSKKETARKIARQVEGVLKVTEELVIVLADIVKVTDLELKAMITEKFQKNFSSAHKEIYITVKEGHVWLDGRLKWNYQKNLAEECIGDLDGIKGINNNIIVPPTLELAIDEKHVFAAIYGDPTIISDIKLEVIGHRIILKGSIPNIDQKNLVTRLVRNVPGVKEIENFLVVDRKHNP